MAVAVLCYVGLTIAEIFVFQAAIGGRGDTEIFWIMNAIQFLAASVTLLVFRACGFRLVQSARSRSIEAATG